MSALEGALRHMVNVGARVRVATSGDDFTGVLAERATYLDGTPAAWVDLDDGPLVIVPLADVRPEGVTV